LVDAASTLLKHLHLLVAECHVVEHYEEVVLIASAQVEVDYVHYSIRFLQKIQCPLVLFPFDELVGGVIQFSHDDWNLVLADPQLLIVVLIESVGLIVET
jgi:hypothetical protein